MGSRLLYACALLVAIAGAGAALVFDRVIRSAPTAWSLLLIAVAALTLAIALWSARKTGNR